MNAKTVVIIIVFLLAIGVGGFVAGQKYKLVPQEAIVPSTITPTQQAVVGAPTTPTLSASSGQAIDESEMLKVAMKQALVAKHGSNANELNITVSKIVGTHATGGASSTGGGGMWLAAKVNGTWKLVWDGNGTIGCADIAPYNFPTSMVPECWNDATQKLIIR